MNHLSVICEKNMQQETMACKDFASRHKRAYDYGGYRERAQKTKETAYVEKFKAAYAILP